MTAAIVVCFLGSTRYSQRLAAHLDAQAVSIATNASPSVEYLSAARGELLRMQLGTERAVAAARSHEPFDRHPVDEAAARMHRDIARYLALPFYPHEQDYWSAMQQAVRRFEREIASTLDDLAAGQATRARTRLEQRVAPAAEDADDALQVMIRFDAGEQHRLGLEIPRLRRHSMHVAWALDGVSSALALLLVGLVLVDYRRRSELQSRFTDQLERLAAASVRVSAKLANAGDLRALLQAITDEARTALDADYAALGCGTDPNVGFDPWVFSGVAPELAAAIKGTPRPVGVLQVTVQGQGPLRLDDAARHPAFRGLPTSHPPLGPFLAVPVRRHGSNIGNLYLARRPGSRPFTAEDEHVIELFGAQAAVATDNAHLYRQLERERTALQLLADASSQIIHSLDYSETLDGIAHALVPELADLCIISVHAGDERGVPPVVAAADPDWASAVHELVRGGFVPAEAPYTRRVRQQRKAEIVAVTPALRDSAEALPLLRRLPIQSLLSVPLVARAKLVGVCTFYSAQPARYDDSALALAEEIARRAALSIDNARLYAAAEAGIRARDEVLAIVSHDLRNPLAAIRLSAQRLAAGGADHPEEVRQSASRIKRSSDQMLRMISDLLDAARIESGTLAAEPRAEPVSALLDDALEMFRSGAAEKSIELVVELAAPPLPDVWCDHDRVLQVFSNLIGNALKFTPPGGRVTVTAQPLGGEVQFAIADSGPGIAASHLPHVFDRFWQARESRRAGAGLGLFISKGIVEAHGGRIWADSPPGCGAVLTFTLPRCAPAMKPAIAPAPPQNESDAPRA